MRETEKDMERETEPEGMFILMTVLPQIARPDETCGEGFVYFSSNFWEVTFVLLTCRPVAKKQHGTAPKPCICINKPSH